MVMSRQLEDINVMSRRVERSERREISRGCLKGGHCECLACGG